MMFEPPKFCISLLPVWFKIMFDLAHKCLYECATQRQIKQISYMQSQPNTLAINNLSIETYKWMMVCAAHCSNSVLCCCGLCMYWNEVPYTKLYLLTSSSSLSQFSLQHLLFLFFSLPFFYRSIACVYNRTGNTYQLMSHMREKKSFIYIAWLWCDCL